jgi:hypothetical protein
MERTNGPSLVAVAIDYGRTQILPYPIQSGLQLQFTRDQLTDPLLSAPGIAGQ